MSVLVAIRVSGDVARFKQLLRDDPNRFKAIADDAKTRGAIHHQFAVGEGFVLVLDEWETAGAFQEFFQSPDIATIMAESGATGEPEVTIAEAIDSPDKF